MDVYPLKQVEVAESRESVALNCRFKSCKDVCDAVSGGAGGGHSGQEGMYDRSEVGAECID